MYEDIDFSTEDGIALVTIERPNAYNAFTPSTLAELNDALRTAINDTGVYGILLSGAGDGFCAGADTTTIPDWESQSKEEIAGFLWGVQNIVRQLRRTGKPSVAAVDGPAIGAGADFALACDLRIVGPDAVLREGFVRIGLIPGDGGAWLLPNLIGESKAKEYLLTGRDISAADAVDIGLAVEEADVPTDAARELLAEILSNPAQAVRRTNDLTDPSLSFEEYCERAIEYQYECINDPEHHEALAAQREEQEPEYDRDYA